MNVPPDQDIPDQEIPDQEIPDQEIPDQEILELIEAAAKARNNAHSPYSQYQVGAALRTVEGAIHVGCNVENSSYGLTICAERCAVGTAVVAGAKEFSTIAICTEDGGTPCGACRQVLAEFGDDIRVICVNGQRDITLDTTITKLLPSQFRL